jgi:hypothetical protein
MESSMLWHVVYIAVVMGLTYYFHDWLKANVVDKVKGVLPK